MMNSGCSERRKILKVINKVVWYDVNHDLKSCFDFISNSRNDIGLCSDGICDDKHNHVDNKTRIINKYLGDFRIEAQTCSNKHSLIESTNDFVSRATTLEFNIHLIYMLIYTYLNGKCIRTLYKKGVFHTFSCYRRILTRWAMKFFRLIVWKTHPYSDVCYLRCIRFGLHSMECKEHCCVNIYYAH